MNSKKVILSMLAVLLCLTILASACDGSSGIGIGRQDESPDPTAGVALGQAGDGESLGSDGFDPVQPVPCKSGGLEKKVYLFEMKEYFLAYDGYPSVTITSPGYTTDVFTSYDPEKERWVFKSAGDVTIVANIVIGWPECTDVIIKKTSNVTPIIKGDCDGDRTASLSEIQSWDNFMIPIKCQLGKDDCTEIDGKCETVNYQLPFAMGGDAYQGLNFNIQDDYTINPEDHPPIPFKGTGVGEKLYSFQLLYK